MTPFNRLGDALIFANVHAKGPVTVTLDAPRPAWAVLVPCLNWPVVAPEYRHFILWSSGNLDNKQWTFHMPLWGRLIVEAK